MEHVNLARELAQKVDKRVTALAFVDLMLTLLSHPLGYRYVSFNFITLFIVGQMLERANIANILRIRAFCGVAIGAGAGIAMLVSIYRPLRIIYAPRPGDTSAVVLIMNLALLAMAIYIFIKLSTPRLGFLTDPTGTPLQGRYASAGHSLYVGFGFVCLVALFMVFINTSGKKEGVIAASGRHISPEDVFIKSFHLSCGSGQCTTDAVFYDLSSDPPEQVRVSWTK